MVNQLTIFIKKKNRLEINDLPLAIKWKFAVIRVEPCDNAILTLESNLLRLLTIIDLFFQSFKCVVNKHTDYLNFNEMNLLILAFKKRKR